nr:uncharacterized protein LOC113706451 [Coffea arabica]
MKSPVSIPEAGTGEQVVSLSDEEETIIDQLTRGSPQRDIVSIVGMPGMTTLAKKLYNDPKVTLHFYACGWCSVSQGHAKRELLVDILSNSGELTDDVYQMADEDMDLKLHQHLMRKRRLMLKVVS